jgi:hypothetical protein
MAKRNIRSLALKVIRLVIDLLKARGIRLGGDFINRNELSRYDFAFIALLGLTNLPI